MGFFGAQGLEAVAGSLALSGTLTLGGDAILTRDAANVVAQKNGTTAQTLRVYGSTTGSKYVAINHDGADGYLNSSFGGLGFSIGGAYKWAVGATVFGFTSSGNFRIAHGTSALATGATEGFFHLQSCAGTPTGTPATIPTGQKPMVWDSTNKKLYVYDGSWMKGQVAAVDVVYA